MDKELQLREILRKKTSGIDLENIDLLDWLKAGVTVRRDSFGNIEYIYAD